MTRRTARQHFAAANLVLGLQVQPLLRVQVAVLPLHVENFRFRPDEFFRLAVTRQAPFHLQRVLLKNGRHVVHLAVARRTPDTFSDVDAVVEINELRKIVNALPLDGLVIAEAGADGFKVRAVAPDLAVAVHAGLRRRHAGGRSGLDRRVAVATINTVVARVVFMAELHRLLFFHIPAGQVRRSRDLGVRVKRRTRQNNRQEQTYPGNVVCAFMKELCHFLILSPPKARKIELRRGPGEGVPRQIPANFLIMLLKLP